ncbi:MAG: S8 family serine peptidase [Lachnospiraceae bacterium]|nr:S8 family serine peptidase [Lachnospiraceae bacterium]
MIKNPGIKKPEFHLLISSIIALSLIFAPISLMAEEYSEETAEEPVDHTESYLPETGDFSENDGKSADCIPNEAVVVTDSRAEAEKTAAVLNGRLREYNNGLGVIVFDRPFEDVINETPEAELNSLEENPDVKVLPQTLFYLQKSIVNTDSDEYKEGTFNSISWTYEARKSISDFSMYNHNPGYTGEGTKVCVIDTGISTTCETSKNVTVSADFSGAGIEDHHGHGTHVAGIIGAPVDGSGIIGIAPDAKLYIAKVTDSEGATLYSILSAFYWAIDQNVDIINISMTAPLDVFSTDEIELFEDIFETCYEKGIVTVTAAGNFSTDEYYFPGCFSHVISVGSYGSENGYYNGSVKLTDLSFFSNYGSWVDIAAPGYIISTGINDSYVFLGGTSQAAPMVAGALALIHETNAVGDTNDRDEFRNMYASLRSVKDDTVFSYYDQSENITKSIRGGLDLSRFSFPGTVTYSGNADLSPDPDGGYKYFYTRSAVGIEKEKEKEDNIGEIMVGDVSVKFEKEFVYNGRKQLPRISVSVDGVYYSNIKYKCKKNKNTGEAYAIITKVKGNKALTKKLKGTKIPFKILPLDVSPANKGIRLSAKRKKSGSIKSIRVSGAGITKPIKMKKKEWRIAGDQVVFSGNFTGSVSSNTIP